MHAAYINHTFYNFKYQFQEHVLLLELVIWLNSLYWQVHDISFYFVYTLVKSESF